LTEKVSTPEPKWLLASKGPAAVGLMLIPSSPESPFHSAMNGTVLRISQPCALATLSGRQR
jgi:hypothetical protein